MTRLYMTPVVVCFVLLAAHFLRDGNLVAIGVCLAAPFLLFAKKAWAARCLQGLLVGGALVWLTTLARLVTLRLELGQPWGRLALILGGVALATALSSLLFETSRLKNRFQLCKETRSEPGLADEASDEAGRAF